MQRLSKGQRAAYANSFAATQPQVSWAQLQAEEAQDRSASVATPLADTPGTGDAIIRGVGQGLTFGLGDEIAAGLASIGKPKGEYERMRDIIRAQNHAAEEANPFTYGVADILGSLAPAVVTGGASLEARGVGAVGKAALAGTAEGAVSGFGYSEASDVGGILEDTLKGAAIGGVTGAVAGHLTDKAIAGAEAKATQNFTRDITAGADPTFRKRFLGQSDKLAKTGNVTEQAASAQAVLEADQELGKLLKAPHAADAQAAADIADHAKGRLNALSSEVRPIYQKLDQEVGQIPMSSVVDWMDGAIDEARRLHSGEALADALTDVRGNFVKVELAKAAKAGLTTSDDVADQIAKLSVPHQDIRQWVTGLLDEKLHKMGSLSETERFTLANEAHKMADKFLKTHLAMVEEAAPALAPDIGRLRELNQQIAVYAGTKQLFEHKMAKGLMRQTAWQDAANSRVNQLAGVIGAAATGSPLGAIKAIAVAEGVKHGIRGVKAADKAITAALAKVVKAARRGDPTAQLVQKAIEVGVPAAAISAALGVYRSGGNLASE